MIEVKKKKKGGRKRLRHRRDRRGGKARRGKTGNENLYKRKKIKE